VKVEGVEVADMPVEDMMVKLLGTQKLYRVAGGESRRKINVEKDPIRLFEVGCLRKMCRWE
jgi:hypothetical protein